MAPEKKILIVEDEPDFRRIYKDFLEAKGYKVLEAGDGEEGLEKAKAEKPDIILLDLMLPKFSGEYVCKIIRNDAQLKDTPIIMLTAKDSDADMVIGRVIGADSYLPKSSDMGQLLGEIDRLILQ